MTPYEITYEVWSERDGVQVRRNTTGGTYNPEPQRVAADQFNREEEHNAQMEGRGVRVRFFVARVLTSYEEMGRA